MRPQILFDLFVPVTTLSGVGPRIGKMIERAAGAQVVDLLWHLPAGLIDRSYSPKLGDATPGRIATLTVRVAHHMPARSARQPYKIRCRDDTGEIDLVFFHARADYLNRALPEGEIRVVSGTLEEFKDQLQMTHPDHIGTEEEADAVGGVEPVYGLTAGLTLNTMGRAVRAALAKAPDPPEWIDESWRARQEWECWGDALERAHAPEDEASLLPESPARMRLAYDELLASQLALLLVRAQVRGQRGRSVAGDGRLRIAAEAALPFTLTPSQGQAVAEIVDDMADGGRMVRLLLTFTGALVFALTGSGRFAKASSLASGS